MNTIRINMRKYLLTGLALASLTAISTLSYQTSSAAEPAQHSNLKPSCHKGWTYGKEYRVELPGGDMVNRVSEGGTDFFILTLTESVPEYSWSPDGSKLVYSDNRVHTVGATGGNRQQISEDDRIVGKSSWSPDGRTIAYSDKGRIAAPDRIDSIVFKDLESGATINVGGFSPTNVMSYSWTPDSRFLVIPGTRNGEDGIVFINRVNGAISHIRFEDEGIEEVAGVIASNDAYYIWGLSWEWDNDDSSLFHPSRIFSYASQGGARQNLNFNLLSDGNSDRSFSLSPDGRRIAFVSNRDGNAEIYVMDIDGGNELRITDNDRDDYEPSWSPDSSRLLYRSYDSLPAERSDIYWQMAEPGADAHNLTHGEGLNMNPLWSPDGSRIAFQSTRFDPSIDDREDYPFRLYTMGAPRTVVRRDRVPTRTICRKREMSPKPEPRPRTNPRANPRTNPRVKVQDTRKKVTNKKAKVQKLTTDRRTKKKAKKKKKRASKKKSAVAKRKSASR